MKVPMIVITGADGSGKSTACARLATNLAARLGSDSVATANIWDSMVASGSFGKDTVVRYLSTLNGAARTLFLFHSMRHSVDLALAKKPKLLLVDSYFYKYAAAELAYGAPADQVRGAALGFARPDLTLFIDVDVAEALKRKSETSNYESGGGEFVKFQESMREHWKRLEAEYGPWVHVASRDTAAATASKLEEAIEQAGLCGSTRSS